MNIVMVLACAYFASKLLIKSSVFRICELMLFCNFQQGELLCQKLDKLSPETGPHKYYIAFRYANPLTEDALDLVEK
jgi:protoheme ferro-lyase